MHTQKNHEDQVIKIAGGIYCTVYVRLSSGKAKVDMRSLACCTGATCMRGPNWWRPSGIVMLVSAHPKQSNTTARRVCSTSFRL
nr:hypothetical protein CFP56_34810 [Quercus suber]